MSVESEAKECEIRDTLSLQPFHNAGVASSASYIFHGVCEHVFSQSCDSERFSIVGDFLTRDLSLGRIGLKVPEGTLILNEDGTYSHPGLTVNVPLTNNLIYFSGQVSLDIIVDDLGEVVQLIASLDINVVRIVRTYKSMNNSVLITTHPQLTGELCGLCGNKNGTLIFSDGVVVGNFLDTQQINNFTNSWLVAAHEQMIHDSRVECGKLLTMLNNFMYF